MTFKYRPEIDGLRAVAVFAVVIYHADFVLFSRSFMPGGYLGVDIFFVISGFLITSIIANEVKSSGKFNYKRFYERRVRRIIPALFLIMLTSIPIAWVTMHPKMLTEYSGSILSSILFSSNIWFWLENSYTAEVSQLKPFLHTWSLSVEEQFYLFFPVLMLVAWKFFRNYVVQCLILVFFVSFIYSDLISNNFSDANFYLLPSRIWELMAGSILAFTSIEKFKISPTITAPLPLIGAAMVMVSLFLFSDTTPHPSRYTLIPIVGTCFIILFASRDEIMTRALSLPAFTTIGLLSYSFYLWHFPAFAFARIHWGEPSTSDKAILIIISLFLSYLTYHLVERPFRHKNLTADKVFYPVIAAALAVLVIFNSAVFFLGFKPAQYRNFENVVDFRYSFSEAFREGTCFLSPSDMNSAPYFENCSIENFKDTKKTALIWGDSHAAQLYTGLTAEIGSEYNIVQRTSSLCAPILDRPVNGRPNCDVINDSILASIADLKPDVVFLAAAWGGTMHEQLVITMEALEKSIGLDKVMIIGPVPVWSEHLPVLLAEQYMQFEDLPEYSRYKLNPNTVPFDKKFAELSKSKGWTYISVTDVVCRAEGCLTRVGPTPSEIFQMDTAHLTEAGSIYLMDRLDIPLE